MSQELFPFFTDVDHDVWVFAPAPAREGVPAWELQAWVDSTLADLYPGRARRRDRPLRAAMAQALSILGDPSMPDPDTGWVCKLLWSGDRSSSPVMVLLSLWPRVEDDVATTLHEIATAGDDVRGPVGEERVNNGLGPGLRILVPHEVDEDGVPEVEIALTYGWRPAWPDGGEEADVVLEVTGTPTEIAAMSSDLDRLIAGLKLVTAEEVGIA